jgi:single-strand DNA-binding protein
MLNTITLMGRLTRDPELRYTQSQTPVASFTLAVDRDFSRSEDKQTDFIDIVAWRQTAEFVSKYFTKGSMAVVNGRLQIREWTDREGNKRRSAEVVADNVYFGEAKRREGGESHSSEPRGSSGGSGAFKGGPSAFSELDDGDGELPF